MLEMEKLHTPADLATYLNVPLRNVWKLIRDGKIRSFRIGRLIRVREIDLEAYIFERLKERSENISEERETSGENNR